MKVFAVSLALIMSCSTLAFAQVAQDSNPAGAAQMRDTMDLVGASPKRWKVNLHSENLMLIQD
ncbi:MAG: hypothetical protein ACK5P7_06130 [Bdellovibrio sp.]